VHHENSTSVEHRAVVAADRAGHVDVGPGAEAGARAEAEAEDRDAVVLELHSHCIGLTWTCAVLEGGDGAGHQRDIDFVL
jgi:hypothetical protein